MAASKSSSIVAKLILARLLVPEYFGFISMVVVFTAIAKVGADLGFRHALVQRRHDGNSRLVYDSAFWLLMFVAVAAVGAMWLIGVPFMVWFYGEPRLTPIAAAMSVSILFVNLQVIPEARLARAMRFKQITAAELFGTLVGCGAAILLAFNGAGVWSLVAQSLLAAGCTAVAMLVLSGWRPRLRFRWHLLRELRSFGNFILGSRALLYAQQNLDYLLIGKMIGAHALGIYSIAFLVTETLRAQVYWLVAKVVFPVYSRALGRKDDIRAIYLGTIRYMALTIFPAATLLMLFAGDAVPVLFTAKWNAAVVPIQILAAASMVVASSGTPGEVLRGVGRPDLDFRINLAVTILVALPALWVGIATFGLPGAALAVLGHYLVSRLAYHLAIHHLIALRLSAVVKAMVPALLGCMLMAAVATVLSDAHWVLAAAASAAAYLAAVLPVLLPHLRREPPSHPPVVVILGPDGAGKTTIARNLEDQIPGGGQRLYLGMGLTEHWAIPFVRSVECFRLQHRSALVRRVASGLMWYLLFPLELIARRLIHRRHTQGGALLIDRLPGRPYLENGALGHAYRYLLPRPDRTVLLTGDPVRIAERKPDETTPARTLREMQKWEAVATRASGGQLIRVDTTANDLQDCTRLILERLGFRTGGSAVCS